MLLQENNSHTEPSKNSLNNPNSRITGFKNQTIKLPEVNNQHNKTMSGHYEHYSKLQIQLNQGEMKLFQLPKPNVIDINEVS